MMNDNSDAANHPAETEPSALASAQSITLEGGATDADRPVAPDQPAPESSPQEPIEGHHPSEPSTTVPSNPNAVESNDIDVTASSTPVTAPLKEAQRPPPIQTSLPAAKATTSSSSTALSNSAEADVPADSRPPLAPSASSTLPDEVESIQAENRLKDLGFTSEELKDSRDRLSRMVKEIDPNASLSPEVEEILMKLSVRFIESATSFACQLASHRESNKIELADLKLFVERTLGLRVPGFGSTDCGDISPSLLANSRLTGQPGRIPDSHVRRMNLKRKAHALTPEEKE